MVKIRDLHEFNTIAQAENYSGYRDYICHHYTMGISPSRLAKIFGSTTVTITSHLKMYGVQLRSRGGNNRKGK